MKFNEQNFNKNSNIIKSYSKNSIKVQNKEYNYNVIVPPENKITKCKININNISQEYIIKNIEDNINFVIIASNNTGNVDKTPIILELNNRDIGIEFMNVASACSSHNILLTENRNFISFFIFN